jgi:plasmid stabilization system protein ParE
MGYLVEVMPRAERDVEDIYEAIEGEESGRARRWLRGLERGISTLQEDPARCPVTPEDSDLRQLLYLYGNQPHPYGLIFRIVETGQRVDILHIRQRAREAFHAGDSA